MSTRLQGDQGEIIALLHYTRLGFAVSVPYGERTRYDLILDRDGKLYRVQVKTTTFERNGSYVVHLTTNGANYTQKSNLKKISENECDLLFVVSGDGRCWEIPTNEVHGMTELRMNTSRDSFLVGQYAVLV